MRTLLIGSAFVALALSLAGCGGSKTAHIPGRCAASGGSLRDRRDREGLPPGPVAERHRHVHEHLGSDGDVHRRSGQDRSPGRSRSGLIGSGRRRSSPRRAGSRRPPHTRSAMTVNGDRGTLYFECHFVDVRTHLANADLGRGRAGGQGRRGMDDHRPRGGVRHADPLRRWGRLGSARERACRRDASPVESGRQPRSCGRSAACPSGSTRSC